MKLRRRKFATILLKKFQNPHEDVARIFLWNLKAHEQDKTFSLIYVKQLQKIHIYNLGKNERGTKIRRLVLHRRFHVLQDHGE